MDEIYSGLILLTYKGKALLMHKKTSPIDAEEHAWSFIGGVKKNKESIEITLMKSVQREMGIKVEKVEFVSDSFYHARLTDDNVNQIQRSEGQLLDFFTLKELRNLFLSSTTEQFLSKHGALI